MLLLARLAAVPRAHALIVAGGIAVGIAVCGAGIAFSAIPQPSGLVHGCVNKTTRALRVIDPSNGATCTSAETPLDFNVVPDPSGPVHGCVSNTTGALRVIDSSNGANCTSAEASLNFNQQGPQGPQGIPGSPATKLFARLSSSGALQYGSGVTGQKHLGNGDYEVSFAKNVTACAITANVDSDGTSPTTTYAANLVIFQGAANGLANNTVQILASDPDHSGADVYQDTSISVTAEC